MVKINNTLSLRGEHSCLVISNSMAKQKAGQNFICKKGAITLKKKWCRCHTVSFIRTFVSMCLQMRTLKWTRVQWVLKKKTYFKPPRGKNQSNILILTLSKCYFLLLLKLPTSVHHNETLNKRKTITILAQDKTIIMKEANIFWWNYYNEYRVS